jgi:hypothetical protein
LRPGGSGQGGSEQRGGADYSEWSHGELSLKVAIDTKRLHGRPVPTILFTHLQAQVIASGAWKKECSRTLKPFSVEGVA